MNCVVKVCCPQCASTNEYDIQDNLENVCECNACHTLFEIIVTTRNIPDSPFYRERDWLLENYNIQDRTLADIASEFGVTPMTIHHWLRRHDIPTRSRGRKVFD